MNMDLDAVIVKARAQLDTVEPVTQEVLLGDAVIGVRVWPISGAAWRELAAQHPARDGVVQDLNLGYNLDGMIREYPRVYIVDGDDVQHVEGEKWAQVIEVLSAPDLDRKSTRLNSSH